MTRYDVAHLITATNLESTVISLQKMEPVICLEHLVAELGETHANFRRQLGLNAMPRQHGAQSEMTSHTTKKLDDILLQIPLTVVHNPRNKHNRVDRNVHQHTYFCFLITDWHLRTLLALTCAYLNVYPTGTAHDS